MEPYHFLHSQKGLGEFFRWDDLAVIFFEFIAQGHELIEFGFETTEV
jgi:hypothetical protein